jgi:hypothetical protein
MKRAIEVFWIVNYLDDIRADFFAIYHIPDWETLDGPLFVSLAERLPLYGGALQARIKLDNETERDYSPKTTEEYTPGQTLSMAEVLHKGDKLKALQAESRRSGGGDIFEYSKG